MPGNTSYLPHIYKESTIAVSTLADRSAKEAKLRRALSSTNTSLKCIRTFLVKG